MEYFVGDKVKVEEHKDIKSFIGTCTSINETDGYATVEDDNGKEYDIDLEYVSLDNSSYN